MEATKGEGWICLPGWGRTLLWRKILMQKNILRTTSCAGYSWVKVGLRQLCCYSECTENDSLYKGHFTGFFSEFFPACWPPCRAIRQVHTGPLVPAPGAGPQCPPREGEGRYLSGDGPCPHSPYGSLSVPTQMAADPFPEHFL